MKIVFLSVSVLMFITFAPSGNDAARILGVVPSPSFSHQIVFRPLFQELAQRGHELVVLTTDPVRNSSLKNLREIDLHDSYKFWNLQKLTATNPIHQLLEILEMLQKVTHYQLTHPEVVEMIQNETEHFDLLFVEALNPTMMAFSERFKCPFVGMVTMDAPSSFHNMMGNPINPVLYPDFQLPIVPPLNFFERLSSFVASVLINTAARYYFMPIFNEEAKKYFGEDLTPVKEISTKMSLLFVNTNPVFQNIRPLTPTTIEIGGGAHITPPKALPSDLKEFLDASKKGVIYFSLGTNVKSSLIEKKMLQLFLDTFKELADYKILWKYDVYVDCVSDNVKIIKWGPQQDILRHPNVKLFITQGGLQSSQEGIHFHKPMVVLPFIMDQFSNAKRIANKGFGLTLDKNNIDKETFVKTIREVIENPKYAESVERASKLIHDQPMTGLEKMVWWTEYVIRNNGTEAIKSKAFEVPMYQVLGLDILAAFYIVYKLFRIVSRKFVNLFRKKDKLKVE